MNNQPRTPRAKAQPRPKPNRQRRGRRPAVVRNPGSKMVPRKSTISRRNPQSSMNVNSNNRCSALERVATFTIPTTSKPGDLLFTLQNNPTSAPRSSAIASQFDSWHGVTSIQVESTGNAFAKNFVVIRHVPNGDPARLPAPGQPLLNIAESYSRRGESIKLQLDSNTKPFCTAPWRGISYNTRKPILDDDPSERNNGLFIIVSNGSPGAEPVDITVRYKYDFHFYGPLYTGILPNLSGRITTGAGTTPTAPLGTVPTIEGNSIIASTANTFTLIPGNYLLSYGFSGTAVTGQISISASAGVLTQHVGTFSTTGSSRSAFLQTQANTVITISALPATTVLSTSVIAAPYSV
nr:structural polyprotein [Bastrovirus sp.]